MEIVLWNYLKVQNMSFDKVFFITFFHFEDPMVKTEVK